MPSFTVFYSLIESVYYLGCVEEVDLSGCSSAAKHHTHIVENPLKHRKNCPATNSVDIDAKLSALNAINAISYTLLTQLASDKKRFDPNRVVLKIEFFIGVWIADNKDFLLGLECARWFP